jgi:hypothetical protein
MRGGPQSQVFQNHRSPRYFKGFKNLSSYTYLKEKLPFRFLGDLSTTIFKLQLLDHQTKNQSAIMNKLLVMLQ